MLALAPVPITIEAKDRSTVVCSKRGDSAPNRTASLPAYALDSFWRGEVLVWLGAARGQRYVKVLLSFYDGGDPDLYLVALHGDGPQHIGSVRRGEDGRWSAYGTFNRTLYSARGEAARALASDYLQRLAQGIAQIQAIRQRRGGA